METLTRIVRDPSVMGGSMCIKGTRVTVGTIVGLVAARHDTASILKLYPYLAADDIREALLCAAWPGQEREVVLPAP